MWYKLLQNRGRPERYPNFMATDDTRIVREDTLTGQIKLYYDLNLPQQLPAPLLIALHGYGANKRQMMREGRQIAPEYFAIASLQGFHQHIKEPREAGGPLRFGFGWLTNFRPEDSVAIHHRALLDLITHLTEQGIADPEKIFLLGFSQTCALNYRFAFTYPKLLRGVIGICGGIPGDWETSELYQPTGAAVMHLTGRRDEFYPPARVADYQERLALRAANLEFKSYDAAHEIVPEMREDLRLWLAEQT
jgi:phospholipase/carboxylesterase